MRKGIFDTFNMFDYYFDNFSSYRNYFVHQNDESYTINISLPGHNKDTVDVEYEDMTLTIIAKYDGDNQLITNKSMSFKLDELCDFQKIKSSMKDGILVIDIPKKETASKKIKFKIT
ncbi:MAG: Hsp20 family protein [Bacilli bacterium]